MTYASSLIIGEIIRLLDVPPEPGEVLPDAYIRAAELVAGLGAPVALRSSSTRNADALRSAVELALLRYVLGDALDDAEVPPDRHT
jgi:hypothetical protein